MYKYCRNSRHFENIDFLREEFKKKSIDQRVKEKIFHPNFLNYPSRRILLIVCIAVRRVTGGWSRPDDGGGTEGITRTSHHQHAGHGLDGLGTAGGQHCHWRQAPANQCKRSRPISTIKFPELIEL